MTKSVFYTKNSDMALKKTQKKNKSKIPLEKLKLTMSLQGLKKAKTKETLRQGRKGGNNRTQVMQRRKKT